MKTIRIDKDEQDWFLDGDGSLICPTCALEGQEEADKAAAEGWTYLFDRELPVKRVLCWGLSEEEYCEECGEESPKYGRGD